MKPPTEPQGPRPSDTELLAGELERMAERATHADHHESPIIDAIRRAPSVRPFVGALRVLIDRLAGEESGAPQGSIVVRLVHESDLDPAVKLGLLRPFLRGERSEFWWRTDFGALLRRQVEGDASLVATVQDAVHAGGPPAVAVVVDWLGDGEHDSGSRRQAESAAYFLCELAAEDPGLVFDALRSRRTLGAMALVTHLASLHPLAAMAFARGQVEAGGYYEAGIALEALSSIDALRDDVRAIATEIAWGPASPGVQELALKVLLEVPPVAPAVWERVKELTWSAWRSIPFQLAARLRDGLTEPLEVIEHWLHRPDNIPACFEDLCDALGGALRNVEGNPLSQELQKRLVGDLAETWRRGAEAGRVARAVEEALYGRTDEEYASLGLGELAGALAAHDQECRKLLLYAVPCRLSRGPTWTTRLLAQIADASDLDGKLYAVSQLAREGSAPDAWSEVEIERLLDLCRASMTPDSAASCLREAIPGDGVKAGLLPIVAWFAREFPHDLTIRTCAERAMRGGEKDPGLGLHLESMLREARPTE